MNQNTKSVRNTAPAQVYKENEKINYISRLHLEFDEKQLNFVEKQLNQRMKSKMYDTRRAVFKGVQHRL